MRDRSTLASPLASPPGRLKATTRSNRKAALSGTSLGSLFVAYDEAKGPSRQGKQPTHKPAKTDKPSHSEHEASGTPRDEALVARLSRRDTVGLRTFLEANNVSEIESRHEFDRAGRRAMLESPNRCAMLKAPTDMQC